MTDGQLVFIAVLLTVLYVGSVLFVWSAGRAQGRDDVIDHGWRPKSRLSARQSDARGDRAGQRGLAAPEEKP